MRTISHGEAKRLLSSLTGEPETIAQLRDYIDRQQSGPKDWESLTDREHNIRAANRAVEAISRVGTLNDDVRGLNARIDALEASNRDLGEVLAAVLGMMEKG